MKKLRYISVQPRLIFYAWQVEVMINNFIRNGIEPNQIDVLIACNTKDPRTSSDEHSKFWDKLVEHFNEVNFYFYNDLRKYEFNYISTIRPNILKQHFEKYTELESEVFFYSDCDILFINPPNFSELINNQYWYVSDTNSYLNFDYIISKGEEIYFKMCDVIGIDETIPVQNNKHSGGAQYIMKGLTAEYWDKVEKDSETLYNEITVLNKEIKSKNADYHELQIWCADMWSVLWNGWLFGNDVRIHEKLNFCWATDPVKFWSDCDIFHNAGVTMNMNRLFHKSDFVNKVPYNLLDKRKYSEGFCSYKYVEEILKTKEVSCLI